MLVLPKLVLARSVSTGDTICSCAYTSSFDRNIEPFSGDSQQISFRLTKVFEVDSGVASKEQGSRASGEASENVNRSPPLDSGSDCDSCERSVVSLRGGSGRQQGYLGSNYKIKKGPMST